MSENTPQHKYDEIFVSYSRKDNTFVQNLIAGLHAKDIGVWFDQEDIDRGRKWWDEVKRGIIGANAVVFVLSPNALRSQVCHWELAFAFNLNKRIIPVLIDDQAMQIALTPDLHEQTWRNPEGELVSAASNWDKLQSINFIIAKEYTPSCVDQILSVARADFEYIDAHKRFLVRAHEWELKGKKTAFVLTGGDLKEAIAWLAESRQKEPAPLTLHREHIAASLLHAKNQRRNLVLAVVGSLALIAVAIVFGVWQSRLAEQRETERAAQQVVAEQEASTSRSRELATTALSLSSDPIQYDLSLVLAVEAYRQNPTFEAYNSLLSLLQLSDRPIGYVHYEANSTSIDIPPSWGIIEPPQEVSEIYSRIRDELNEELLPTEGWISAAVKSQTSELYAVAFCPAWEGMRFCEHNVIRIYDLSDGSLVSEIDRGHENIIFSLAFSPDNQHLASGSDDSTLRIWDIETSDLTLTIPHPYYVVSLAYSPNGAMIASGTGTVSNDASTESTIRLWDTASGDLIRTLIAHEWMVSHLQFSANGRRLASWDTNWVRGYVETILLWNVGGRPVLESTVTNDVPSAAGGSISTSPFEDTIVATSDDRQLVAVSSGSTSILTIKEANSGSVVAALSTLEGVGARDPYSYAASIAQFSPDNRFIVSFHDDRTVRLWNIESQLPVFELHDDALILDQLAFNPSGMTLAVGGCEVGAGQPCLGGVIHLVDVETALLIGSPIHLDSVRQISWTNDSNLAVTTDDQVVYWELAPHLLAQDACIIANRDLTEEEWARYIGDAPYRRTCSEYLTSTDIDTSELYARN